ncbi:MAG: T9SS type A sorting domain-containing protein [Sphingobacteriales bacterium]|jgi:hypothetical protein|nr:T9SS type A sorting domain-containing protein [Sphingobacteriales bacterium]MBP9141178.1 T9SS type A sorting domain-containing protein [Chitinophagales bacterium]MDA0198146.1 Ig-like domain-containing protein [Bacteroidota bacterium]MBK6889291.1 T9SS type A sorting domain-containing protein [Sphingobacteriales bacterium]MBK7528211.1 T9SS type A sorting domain-containing protein [Sphingobacteriales bacterium]
MNYSFSVSAFKTASFFLVVFIASFLFATNYTQAQCSYVSGYAWFDQNMDGIYDPIEAPAPDMTIALIGADSTFVTTETNANGFYQFDIANQGTYSLTFFESGYTLTTPNNFTFFIACGTTFQANFGVSPNNTFPQATDDEYYTYKNEPYTFNPTENDLTLGDYTIEIITGPNHGTITDAGGGYFIYTPDTGFTGTDELTYEICSTDFIPICDQATVTFIVVENGNFVVANDDNVSINIDNSANINVLANDYTSDSLGILTITIIDGPLHGTAETTPSGTIFYTPDTGFIGTDYIAYQICDDATPPNCDTALVTITVDYGCGPIEVCATNNQAHELCFTECIPEGYVINSANTNNIFSEVEILNEHCIIYTPNFPEDSTFTFTEAIVVTANIPGTTFSITFTVLALGNMCDDAVWPGDTDDNGEVNMEDLLNIGIGYGTSDIARNDNTIDWYGHPYSLWTNQFDGEVNYAHADCNGSGTIDDADTVAVAANYGKIHAKGSQSLVGTPLFVQLPTEPILEGSDIDMPIILGTQSQPLDEIYGLVFTVNYDATLLKEGTLTLDINPSWLGNNTDRLHLWRNEFNNGQFQVGIVGKNQLNRSGYGQIAKAHAVIIDNIAGKGSNVPFAIKITDVKAIKLDGSVIEVAGEETAVDILSGVADPNNPENASATINITPNPANNFVTIKASDGQALQSATIYNAVGQQVLHQQGNKAQIIFELKNLAEGIYYVGVQTSNGSKTFQKLIIAQ